MTSARIRRTTLIFSIALLLTMISGGPRLLQNPSEWIKPQAAVAFVAEMPRVITENPYLSARRALANRDAAGAEAVLKQALPSSGSASIYLQALLAEARLAQGDTSSALALLDDVASRTPRAVARRALQRAAELRASSGNYAAAKISYGQLLDNTTGDDRRAAEVALARVEAASGDSSSALARVRAALRASGSPQISVLAADALLSMTPSDPLVARTLAPLYYDAGHFPRAASLYQQALAAGLFGAARPSALLQLGRCYERGDEFRTAIGVYRRILAEYPSFSPTLVRYRIGLCHQRVGEDEEGEKYFASVLTMDPRSSFVDDILYRMGTRQDRRDDREAARGLYHRLLTQFPRSPWADECAWKIGFGFLEDGRPADALVTFESALRRYPRSDFAPAIGYWRARILEDQGRLDDARSGYAQLLRSAADAYYRGRAAAAFHRLGGRFTEADLARATALASTDLPVAIRELRMMRDAADGELAAQAGQRVAELTGRVGSWGDLARLSNVLFDSPALLLDGVAASAKADPAVLEEITSLLELGAYDEAVAEIREFRVDAGARPERRLAMARILAEGGAYRTAMREVESLVRSLGGPTDAAALPPLVSQLLYPRYYPPLVRAESARYGLDYRLVLAVIREESRFQADVASWAGAQGLMQIMPATGASVARELGWTSFNFNMLHDPNVNVALGTHYIDGLMKQYEGKPYLVLAGYNAGPGNANRWIRQNPGVPDDVFVERITFRETRNYVKRVLGTYWTYRQLDGEWIGTL